MKHLKLWENFKIINENSEYEYLQEDIENGNVRSLTKDELTWLDNNIQGYVRLPEYLSYDNGKFYFTNEDNFEDFLYCIGEDRGDCTEDNEGGYVGIVDWDLLNDLLGDDKMEEFSKLVETSLPRM